MRAAFRLLISISLAISFTALSHTSATHTQIDRIEQLDILIRHGKVVDGSGNNPRTTDVGIRGDRIVLVGDADLIRRPGAELGFKATRTIDATGMTIAPGFIDP